MQHKWLVTRTPHTNIYSSNSRTAIVGRSPIRLSIYDKLVQASSRESPTQQSLLAQSRWEGRIPHSATRVEYQLRAAFLESKGIRSLEDYLVHRADLAQFLTHRWVRICSRKPVKNNTARSPVHPDWLAVQRGFHHVYGNARGLPLAPLPRGAVDLIRLRRQLVGAAVSLAVRQRRFPGTVDQLHGQVGQELRAVLPDDEALHERLQRRAAELGIEIPCPGAPDGDGRG